GQMNSRTFLIEAVCSLVTLLCPQSPCSARGQARDRKPSSDSEPLQKAGSNREHCLHPRGALEEWDAEPISETAESPPPPASARASAPCEKEIAFDRSSWERGALASTRSVEMSS